MNKLIWKGIDSSTIKGLLICELPPITKPKMRVQETVIDGVDGSIIEELGYESYDKTIKIGLTYDFDIDEIIKYFSGEGEVVFSNEPDKYYKASILNRIDYERLLRFREATVKFRVQPFKYQHQEEKLIAKTGSVDGTEIKISDVKAIQLQMEGRSIQKTRSGKNLFNIDGNVNVAGNNGNTVNLNTVSNNILTTNVNSYTGHGVGQKFTNLNGKTFTFSARLVSSGEGLSGMLSIYDNNELINYVTFQSFKSITYTGTSDNIVVAFSTYNGTGAQFTDIQVELGETVTSYESYGTSPSPDYPSKIQSVGYENLFDKLTIQDNKAILFSDGTFSNDNNYISSDYIEVEPNTNYYCNYTIFSSSYFGLAFYNNNKVYLSGNNITNLITTPSNAKYLRFCVRKVTPNTTNIDTLQLEKGLKVHSYIPYGKYGIEVKTVSKNLFNKATVTHNKTLSSTGETQSFSGSVLSDYISIKSNTNYYLSGVRGSNYVRTYAFYDENKNFISFSGIFGDENVHGVITTPSNACYMRVVSGIDYYISCQVEEGNAPTEYQPYQSNTSLIVLDEPLRSLSNGVKDIVYIKNNKLYVDRYIGSIVLDGSENWAGYTSKTNTCDAYYIKSGFKNNGSLFSNYFNKVFYEKDIEGMVLTPYSTSMIVIKINKSRVSSEDIDGIKTWLSTHNTEVIYELATSITEEYGEFPILDLLDGENNITNSSDAKMLLDYIETLTVNNLGNYISKPIFEIEGIGTINFILNNSNVFSYNFDDDDKVVIDSEKEDAYLGLTLKNRNMNGNFPIFNPGENKITWDGIIKNINVVKKSRWL